ncbi:hypothetical protein AB1K62_11575 [Parasphingorhabdus sp. JC815]|uniref:hypothetical protein n=1 Tax=Parasphingorhabdus sp. JC815 TaxID=3232140 RepID=UPI003457BEF4
MAKLLLFAALTSAALSLSGCASLGGNISGSFDCRAPGGTCAPTSAIDVEATGQDLSPVLSATPKPRAAKANGLMLRVVLAGYRDAEGRLHDARVVHVALPEAASANFQPAKSAADIGKAIARTIRAPQQQLPDETNLPNPFSLPDAMVFPSPKPMADPGVLLPGHEGSGVIAPLHDRAPYFKLPQTDTAKKEDVHP